MKRPDEVTEFLRCGGENCDNACATQFDRLDVEDCKTWRVYGYVQQLEARIVHLEALNQQNLSVITMQERTRARLEEQISQLESRVPHWIPVEERLPEECLYVIVYLRGGSNDKDIWHIDADYFEDGEWHRYPGNGYYKPTHWMPLPEPTDKT